ncbi:MAG: nitrous oxide reductase family maturation protein NosD [Spirochaetia bacterium]|nr:nitrous oxide reductase family maturation protein NosD [Spirochaetia bacterium]
MKISKAGDSIVLKPGIYREHNILIDKSITLHGNQGAVIDGDGKGTILKIQAENVTISSLKIINAGHSYTQDFSGILIRDSRNFTIRDNILEKMYFGIKIENSSEGVIESNSVSGENKNEAGAGNGVHIWHSSKIQVIDNRFYNMRDGIYFEFVENSSITENVSRDNIRYGLHFMFSNNNSYQKNIFENNGAGVAVMFSKFTIMRENIFKDNWGTASYGLLLKEIYDAEIINNQFIRNTIAVSVEGSTRINYRKNNFIRNGWGIKVIGACYKNIFSENNFIGNALDVSYNSKANDNQFSGNYWSSYTGYDLDRNGIGDVPHRPVKLFSFIVNRTPEAIILLRSMFVDLINFSEKVTPIFTPDDIIDEIPAMRAFQ